MVSRVRISEKDRFLDADILRLVDTLDHFEVPFIGRLANSFVDNE